MSHPSKTPKKTNNSAESITSSTRIKETTACSSNTIKRANSDEVETEAKKLMVNYLLSKQQSEYSATIPIRVKFVSDETMVAPMNTNNNAIPQISDEELLEMALMFEKKQQP
ncbi:unnamed protein product [Rotaria sordida]|uniref:Uncharacterized protein n=1 Tax=Rotaria sordida TaxID=392033 RepID=A0A819H040_9BILA|nr:unnamed protein product [Rotaria sordida]CAF3892370.1 unnamed protein product [Rotaria sordida]